MNYAFLSREGAKFRRLGPQAGVLNEDFSKVHP